MSEKISLKRMSLFLVLGGAAGIASGIALARMLPQAWDVPGATVGLGTLGAVVSLLAFWWTEPGGLTTDQRAILKTQGLFAAGWLVLVSGPTFVVAGPEPMIISALAGGLITSLLWVVRLR